MDEETEFAFNNLLVTNQWQVRALYVEEKNLDLVL